MNPASASRLSTSQHTPGVNYHATSERIYYEDLSPDVRHAADVALGSPVVRAAAPVTSGFTRAYAGHVLLQDGRHAFLKATGPDLPIPLKALRREAQMLRALGDRTPSVPMIGAREANDGGQVLALGWIDGHLPGFPWTDDEVALVRTACESVATVPSSVLDGLAPGRLADDLLDDDQLQAALDGGQLAMPASMEHLPGWLPARVDELLELARRSPTLLVGDHLNHFDLRPDNLLIGRGVG
ncbi:MAG: phosphotransferase family protein, partial [Dermatophilaceae bacterium]